MASRDINLLPQEIKSQRKKDKVKSSVGNWSLIILVVVVSLSLVAVVVLFQAKLSLNKVKGEIVRQQSKIKDLGIIEAEAQRLDAKIVALGKIINHRKRFSLLLEAVGASTPQEINITNLASFADNKIAISGQAGSYPSLSRFITTLIEPSLGGKVFAAADLTSASLDEVTGRIRFSLTIYLKENSLK